jgi:hypothetical protein
VKSSGPALWEGAEEPQLKGHLKVQLYQSQGYPQWVRARRGGHTFLAPLEVPAAAGRVVVVGRAVEVGSVAGVDKASAEGMAAVEGRPETVPPYPAEQS